MMKLYRHECILYVIHFRIRKISTLILLIHQNWEYLKYLNLCEQDKTVINIKSIAAKCWLIPMKEITKFFYVYRYCILFLFINSIKHFINSIICYLIRNAVCLISLIYIVILLYYKLLFLCDIQLNYIVINILQAKQIISKIFKLM